MSQVTRLGTGLRVVHRQVPGALAAVYLWFDAGTVDEGEGERGAAHLLEHMLFKGTAQRGVGEVAAAIEALGGDLNAYTTWDQTVLHATVLAEHWAEALEVLADMAWSSALLPEELAREAPVVHEEIRGYDADPDAVLEDALTAALFPEHPYGRPVLGTLDSVAGIDRARLAAFWRQHYTANRCVLAVAGPMQRDQVLEAAERLAPPTGPERAAVPPAPRPAGGIVRVPRAFETSLVALGYPAPGDDAPPRELAALEVLAAVLGAGRASRLQAQLRVGERLVADAWASLITRRSAGSFEIGLAPTHAAEPGPPGAEDAPSDPLRRAQVAEALEAALDLVERVRATGIRPQELDRARQGLLADLLEAEETVDGVAHELAWFTARSGGPEGRAAWKQALVEVELEDVHQAARRWLVQPIVRVLDDADAPGPALTLPARAPAPRRADPRILRSGPADGWAHQGPIASIYLAFPGGKLLEQARVAGLVSAWASMVTSGAGDHSGVGLATELDRLAASLRAVAGRNSVGLHLSVPATHLDPAVELLGQVLAAPRFDAQDWAREREEVALDLDTLPDRPDDVMARRVWRLAFAGHPWGQLRTRTTLAAISPRRLRAFHQDWLTRRAVQVGVAGAVDPERVAELLGPLLDALPEGESLPARPALGPHPTGLFRSQAGSEQALVTWAARAPALDRDQDAALRVAVGLLSAQAGRLFLALRERRSLAYSVWARLWEGVDGGLFAMGLATDPRQEAAARAGLLAELDRLRSQGPDAAELDRTRAMLLGQHGMGMQRSAGRASQIAVAALHGRDPSLAAERAALQSVDAGAVREAVAALPEGFVVVVRP